VPIFREYRKTDLEAMVAMDVVCFPPEFRFSRRAMMQFAEARNAITIIAEADDAALAGFIIAHVERVATGTRGYLATIDVAPEHRRAGLAEHLMQLAERAATAHGAAHMELHVSIENGAAIRLYDRCGYKRTEVVPGFYGEGIDAYGYRKETETGA